MTEKTRMWVGLFQKQFDLLLEWLRLPEKKIKNCKYSELYPRVVRELSRVWEICWGWWGRKHALETFSVDDTRMSLFDHVLRHLPLSYQGVWCDAIVKKNELFINTCFLNYKVPALLVSQTFQLHLRALTTAIKFIEPCAGRPAIDSDTNPWDYLTTFWQIASRVLKIMPLRRSTSCEFTSFSHSAEYRQERFKERRTRSARKKSVQWSVDLEEVRYFVPHRSRSESIKRKFKKVKKRAEQLNDNWKTLKAFTSTAESRTTRLRIIGRYAKCFSHESGLQSFEEYNKQWDLLFEMYTSRDNYSLETASTQTLWNSPGITLMAAEAMAGSC